MKKYKKKIKEIKIDGQLVNTRCCFILSEGLFRPFGNRNRISNKLVWAPHDFHISFSSIRNYHTNFHQ